MDFDAGGDNLPSKVMLSLFLRSSLFHICVFGGTPPEVATSPSRRLVPPFQGIPFDIHVLGNPADAGYACIVDRDEMLRVLKALENEGVEYVLIGAAAMGVHGVVRATEDLDIFIRAIPDNVERLRRALRTAFGDDPSIDEISTEDLLGEYPAVRYYPPTGDLYLDIMTHLGPAASYETVEADTKTVAGVRIRVATPLALYHLKKGTIRPLDHQDAAMLRQAFNLEDDGP